MTFDIIYLMKVRIRPAKKSDLPKYVKLLQKTYQDIYTDEKIGLTEECFSEEVFSSSRNQKYLASNLSVSNKQKCWIAFIDNEYIGSISIVEREQDYELRGFYVATKYQNRGVGKKLWQLALKFAKDKDITCDIYAHNTKTIAVYKKWGFSIDLKKREFYRHWPEWPKGVQAKSVYMRYKVKR